MISRRTFLKSGVILGTGLILPIGCSSGRRHTASATQLDAAKLTKYLDPLPVPSALSPLSQTAGVTYYEITASAFTSKLHSQLSATNLWGYNGLYPGPTIEARKGEIVKVKWINGLKGENHLLEEAYDVNLHGTNMGEPHIRTVTHLHGGHVPQASDGYPLDWFRSGESSIYEYPNSQRAATLWYHDHVIGITRLNVYAGLAGFYIIRDSEEDALGLPNGDHEIPLVIQDRSFYTDGSLKYDVRDTKAIPTNSDHPGPWIPEMFGTAILVNGKVWPYLEVERRKYRFRLLNGSNARFYRLELPGISITQIGSDGGLLATPVTMESLTLSPGERADVIVDFSSQAAGAEVIMLNTGPDEPFMNDPTAAVADPNTTGQVMKFRIKAAAVPDTWAIPATLATIASIPESEAILVRDMTLEEIIDEVDEPISLQINGMDFDDPILEKPALGTTEIWRVINLSGDTHPFHVHLVQFQVLDRTPFDAEAYLAALTNYRAGKGDKPDSTNYLTGSAVTPPNGESGWKDTVMAHPGEVLRIIMRFETYKGKYPIHCHILDHEDNSMMIQFETV